MKNLVFYITLILILSAMTLTVFNEKENVDSKVITVSTSYRYLLDQERLYEIFMYINDFSHPMMNNENYQIVYLSDDVQDKKIEIEVTDIKIEYYEKYLNETYARVVLKYQVYFVADDMMIKDVYLNVILINGDHYAFYIGDIYFMIEAEDGNLNFKTLSGEKALNSIYSRLKHVIVGIDIDEDITIESIKSGYDRMHTFRYEDQKLEIEIDLEDKLLHNLAFKITYTQNNKTYEKQIDNFRYIIEYETLKESGVLLNIYGLH